MSVEEIKKLKLLNHNHYLNMTKIEAKNKMYDDLEEIHDRLESEEEKTKTIIIKKLLFGTLEQWASEYYENVDIVTDIPYLALRQITKELVF